MVAQEGRSIFPRQPWTVSLVEDSARNTDLVGAKAAALAAARAEGLPVLNGFVLTVDGGERFSVHDPELRYELRNVWAALPSPLVVRSSSTIEDQGESSMAGVFTSVLDVETWEDFLLAVARVLASGRGAPMAVLIQPQLDAAMGGVMFGLDPLTGRTDRLVVATVEGGPDALVSGRASGRRTSLSLRGRRLESEGDGPLLSNGDSRRLANLAASVNRAFGGPQDVEWAVDRDDRLWLLQSRPITAMADTASASGPVFGPGPLAETFPQALSVLEKELWLAPIEEALRVVLPLVGAATEKATSRSPIVIDVAGRPAVDLELMGALKRRGFLAKLDPRPSVRRLGASWRVGRLRAALPALAGGVIDRIDEDLRRCPAPSSLSDSELLNIIDNSRQVLVSVHAHELMSGLLESGSAGSGAAFALSDLAIARAAGLDDEEIVAHYPSTLLLLPPRIGGVIELPAEGLAEVGSDAASVREELRLRARLVQELVARVALELGTRLTARGALPDPASVRWAHLDELSSLIGGDLVPLSWQDRVPAHSEPELPAMFKLSQDGAVVTVRAELRSAAVGASAGRAEGIAFDGMGTAPPDAILVVRTLDPSLAPLLPQVIGLVAETGSVLSHLAILARELGIPTVVGVPDAVERFPAGARVAVDGSQGEVVELEMSPA